MNIYLQLCLPENPFIGFVGNIIDTKHQNTSTSSGIFMRSMATIKFIPYV